MREFGAPATPMVVLDGLAKRYGEFAAFDNLNLTVQRGELFALLGPNGAGKTTCMRILMGFLKASAGSARIDGLDCFHDRVELKRQIGYLPDEPVFYDYLKGGELLHFCGRMHGLPPDVVEDRAGQLAEVLELGPELQDYAMNYSRGMKKKLALACALLHDPALLILDEPSSGLDPIATRALNGVLQALRGSGTTILLSSHLLDQVERLADRIAIIAHGEVAAVGTPEELRTGGTSGSLEELFFAVAGQRGGQR
jgi:ABC-2 type transport system ATP-binding protein